MTLCSRDGCHCLQSYHPGPQHHHAPRHCHSALHLGVADINIHSFFYPNYQNHCLETTCSATYQGREGNQLPKYFSWKFEQEKNAKNSETQAEIGE